MATPPNNARILTTAELAAATAGGRDYIRTRNNVPVGLALRENFNPEGPDVIVFGPGPRVAARARLLMDHGRCSRAVPVYVKCGTDMWVYRGEYRATDLRFDAATLQRYGSIRRGVSKVAGVLFQAPMEEPTVLNLSLAELPRKVTATMHTTAIRATRRAYSTREAPRSSSAKRARR